MGVAVSGKVDGNPEEGEWAHKSIAWEQESRQAELWRSLLGRHSLRDHQLLK